MNTPINPKLAVHLAKLERMSPRERIVVTVCICAVSWFVLTAFVVTPGERERATYEQLVSTQQETLVTTTQELEGLRTGSVPPGDPALHEQLRQLDKENLSADASLRASQQYLVPPETMSALLQDLLRRDKRLELVSMETLPVAPILDTSKQASAPVAEPAAPVAPTVRVAAEQSTAPAVETTMFRHGVRIVVRGNFLNVLDYLQEVEKLRWRMYWGAFAMQTSEAEGASPPAAPLYSLSIYTLSLDKSWLKL
ncbi:MAG: putative mannose-sensitive agglutinin biosis protein MshJ [Rhodocyclales bacterium]|nr:putative mannose-sensitive agglutinin biosis protein MshJ [Rhodocyclales bacterium]